MSLLEVLRSVRVFGGIAVFDLVAAMTGVAVATWYWGLDPVAMALLFVPLTVFAHLAFGVHESPSVQLFQSSTVFGVLVVVLAVVGVGRLLNFF